MINEIILGDCLVEMQNIPDKSVDMILCDLPYGTTACKWDTIIPFEPLWQQYKRIIKDNGAIVLTASQPFTTDLISSNRKYFRYCLVWDKKRSANPMLAKVQPLKVHEDIVVFYKSMPSYNPQMGSGEFRNKKSYYKGSTSDAFQYTNKQEDNFNNQYYPKSILDISNANQSGKIHPTQKPVALFEYLIKTYTNEGETVLDNCAGSGTTAIACLNTNRNYICIEKEPKYYEIAQNRINEHIKNQKNLFNHA